MSHNNQSINHAKHAPQNLGVLFHKIGLDGPQPQPLAVEVQRDRKHQTGELDAAESKENALAAFVLEPAVEKERKDEAVENVCMIVRISNS